MSLPVGCQQDDTPYRNDLRLVTNILAGCEDSWHAFLEKYAGLVTQVAGRFLFDEDEVAAVQAEVFRVLYTGKLAGYIGRSSLAAWVAVVTRNITADHLRNKFGRREIPVGLKKFSAFHRQVFCLYYIDGATFPATLARLREKHPDLAQDELLAALQDINDSITDKTLRRISYDLAGHSVGAASGRLLEYCQTLSWDEEDSQPFTDPLTRLILQEAGARAKRILALIDELPEEDRRVLNLRFDKGMRAKEIATQLDLSGQRKAYTLIDRILKKIRRMVDNDLDESL